MVPGAATELETSDGVSRREFLRVGGLSVLGLTAAEQRAAAERNAAGMRQCIFLLLTGGPSSFETFDPKPSAPADVRGPFRAISTRTSGVFVSETLPLLAQRTDKLTLLRSLSHDAAPLHETGQQLVQTGRLSRGGVVPPSLGSIVAQRLGSRNRMPAYAVLPTPLGNTGVAMWQGQRGGCLGPAFDPWDVSLAPDDALHEVMFSEEAQAALAWQTEPEPVRRAYGESRFGRSCLLARRLVEAGTRFVTVNMFDELANQVTWDCHARGQWSPGTLSDYSQQLCPDFDRAFAALIDDLSARGMLDKTLVVAVGEFGRSPRINESGGRDHWTGVWSAVLAGGGVAGGQVLGGSDPRGIAPADRPVHPGELAATILQVLGVDLSGQLTVPGAAELAVTERTAIAELIG